MKEVCRIHRRSKLKHSQYLCRSTEARLFFSQTLTASLCASTVRKVYSRTTRCHFHHTYIVIPFYNLEIVSVNYCSPDVTSSHLQRSIYPFYINVETVTVNYCSPDVTSSHLQRFSFLY